MLVCVFALLLALVSKSLSSSSVSLLLSTFLLFALDASASNSINRVICYNAFFCCFNLLMSYFSFFLFFFVYVLFSSSSPSTSRFCWQQSIKIKTLWYTIVYWIFYHCKFWVRSRIAVPTSIRRFKERTKRIEKMERTKVYLWQRFLSAFLLSWYLNPKIGWSLHLEHAICVWIAYW